MQNRDDEPNSGQRCKQTETDRVALPSDGCNESVQRDINGERPHHVVEVPLRFAGLQLVMTIDAASLAGQRRIDRAQHLMAVDHHSLGARSMIGGRSECLDGFRHCGIGRRRLDFATGQADRAQHERSMRPGLIIEGVDRIGAEGGGHRGVGPELRADARIVRHEGVDQPKRRHVLIGLLGQVRLQAGAEKIICRESAKGSGKSQIDGKCAPCPRPDKPDNCVHYCHPVQYGMIASRG